MKTTFFVQSFHISFGPPDSNHSLTYESTKRFLVMQRRTGKCLCGAVRFEALGEPELIHACHCKNCQLMSGSAFFLVAYYVDHNVDITTGDLTKFNRSCDSGRGITIYLSVRNAAQQSLLSQK